MSTDPTNSSRPNLEQFLVQLYEYMFVGKIVNAFEVSLFVRF